MRRVCSGACGTRRSRLARRLEVQHGRTYPRDTPMPSVTHEALVELFKNRPTLAAEMLHDALGQPVPAFTEGRVEPSDLSEIVPSDRRADVVVVLLVAEQRRPAMAVVVEVQLGVDVDKPQGAR